MNILYYGDNLTIMREKIASNSIDLIYLDPPFNSQQIYNVYLGSNAQIEAFKDTWHWNLETEQVLSDIILQNSKLTPFISSLVDSLGRNSLMAYLIMMLIRIIEFKRILKDTGSLYLHCDPTACHYLKVILDLVFGINNFHNQIVWKRTSAHSSSLCWGKIQDNILFYSKSNNYIWNKVHIPNDKAYIEKFYNNSDKNGRNFQAIALTAPGVRTGDSGKPWRGIDPTSKGRHWAIPRDFLSNLDIP